MYSLWNPNVAISGERFKKEEGRFKKEDGRFKKEEGRFKKEDGRFNIQDSIFKIQEGRFKKEIGYGEVAGFLKGKTSEGGPKASGRT